MGKLDLCQKKLVINPQEDSRTCLLFDFITIVSLNTTETVQLFIADACFWLLKVKELPNSKFCCESVYSNFLDKIQKLPKQSQAAPFLHLRYVRNTQGCYYQVQERSEKLPEGSIFLVGTFLGLLPCCLLLSGFGSFLQAECKQSVY